MKYCSKCGKEIFDEAVICPGCGCAVSSTVSNHSTHTTIKTSYRKLFLMSMMSGGIFGLFMGLVFFALLGEAFFLVFLACGLMFALLFFGMMAACIKVLETTTFKKMRQRIEKTTKIYFEGSANRNGNGGRLFVTANGIEHHPHQVNLNSQSLLISYESIIYIQKGPGDKLIIQSSDEMYTFVVDRVDEWIMLFSKHEFTKNKLQ